MSVLCKFQVHQLEELNFHSNFFAQVVQYALMQISS